MQHKVCICLKAPIGRILLSYTDYCVLLHNECLLAKEMILWQDTEDSNILGCYIVSGRYFETSVPVSRHDVGS